MHQRRDTAQHLCQAQGHDAGVGLWIVKRAQLCLTMMVCHAWCGHRLQQQTLRRSNTLGALRLSSG